MSTSTSSATRCERAVTSQGPQRRCADEAPLTEVAKGTAQERERKALSLKLALTKLQILLMESLQEQQRLPRQQQHHPHPGSSHVSEAAAPPTTDGEDPFTLLEGGGKKETESNEADDRAFSFGRPLPALQLPIPPAELRVQERHRREEKRRRRKEEEARRRQRLAEPPLGSSAIATAVAARLLCAATGGAPFFETAATPMNGSESRKSGSPIRRTPAAAAATSPPFPAGRDAVGRVYRATSNNREEEEEGSVRRQGAEESEEGGEEEEEDPCKTPKTFELRSPGSSGFCFRSSSSSTLGRRRLSLSSSGSGSDSAFSSSSAALGFHGWRAEGPGGGSRWSRNSPASSRTSTFAKNATDKHNEERRLGLNAGQQQQPLANTGTGGVGGGTDEEVAARAPSPSPPSSHSSSRLRCGDGDSVDASTHRTALAEMDAIEQGLTAPYRAYLFSPQARVVDLRDLMRLEESAPGNERAEGDGASASSFSDLLLSNRSVGGAAMAAQPQWSHGSGGKKDRSLSSSTANVGQRDGAAATAMEATCAAFSPVGSCYLVGCSQGSLVFFAVAPPAEGVTHTTYLGSLRKDSERSPPQRPSTTMTAVGSGAEPGTKAADSSGTTPPVVLSLAHTAAVTSIAFNDDGSMFASASVDMTVMLWNTATQAKLRRLRVGSPLSLSSSSSPPLASDGGAPRIALFTPLNNNYLLVCSRQAGVLYSCSTGLPVAVGAGGGGGSTSGKRIAGGGHAPLSGANGSVTGLRRRAHAATPSFITTACMDPDAAPFFFLGDTQGNVQMYSYRAGEAAVLPTLVAKDAPGLRGGEHGGGDDEGHHQLFHSAKARGGDDYRNSLLMGGGGGTDSRASLPAATITHSRQLPELRCVAYLSLDSNTSTGSFSAPFYPIGRLEVCAVNGKQCQSILTAQQRLMPKREERLEMGYWSAREEARKTQRPPSGKADGGHRDGGGGGEHGLLEIPERIAGAFSSLFTAASSALGGGGSGSRQEGAASHRPHSSSSGKALTGAPDPPSPQPQLCALTLIASQPCDCVSVIGVTIDFPCASAAATAAVRAKRHSGAHGRDAEHQAARTPSAKPRGPPEYHLVRLLDIRGVCRLRHVGAGAVPTRDNAKLLAMAVPCEEGFVRVVTSSVVERKPPLLGNDAHLRLSSNRSPSVVATLPIPWGGRCVDLAWSPDSRFLVAVAKDGVVYQWERIYLIGESLSPFRDGEGSPRQGESGAASGDPAVAGGFAREGKKQKPAGSATVGRGGGGKPSSSATRQAVPSEFPEDLHSAGQSDTVVARSRRSVLTAAHVGGGEGGGRQSLPLQSSHKRDALELEEEEKWRESLVREQVHQLTIRRQRRLNRVTRGVRDNDARSGTTAPAAGGRGNGSAESSGYWLVDDDDDANASSGRTDNDNDGPPSTDD